MTRTAPTRPGFSRIAKMDGVALEPAAPTPRTTRAQPVTAKMYRHFAVVTGAVTLLVGLFADGEQREAIAREQQKFARPAAAPQSGGLVVKPRQTVGSFSGDNGFDGPMGAPMDAAGAAAQDGILPTMEDQPAPARGVPGGLNRYGVSAQAWAALTEAQRQALIARYEAEQQAALAPQREMQIGDLTAASLARSGPATSAD